MYRVLNLMPKSTNMFTQRTREPKRRRKYLFKPREETMEPTQDWPSVWPTAKTFAPSAVPLPMRQSFELNFGRPPRGKYANTELVKVANFLHLTPVAIERHCEALRKFCTDWPEGLETESEVRCHFPVTYVTKDYVHSSPTIRDVRARIVELKVNIADLKLDAKDADKMIRLADHRYNKNTGEITITADACPTKTQNKDYSDYLLTALYFESIEHQEWEEDKPECDWERFYWDKSDSKSKVENYLKEGGDVKDDIIEDYKQSVEKIFENENFTNLESYRSSVEKLIGINSFNAKT